MQVTRLAYKWRAHACDIWFWFNSHLGIRQPELADHLFRIKLFFLWFYIELLYIQLVIFIWYPLLDNNQVLVCWHIDMLLHKQPIALSLCSSIMDKWAHACVTLATMPRFNKEFKCQQRSWLGSHLHSRIRGRHQTPTGRNGSVALQNCPIFKICMESGIGQAECTCLCLTPNYASLQLWGLISSAVCNRALHSAPPSLCQLSPSGLKAQKASTVFHQWDPYYAFSLKYSLQKPTAQLQICQWHSPLSLLWCKSHHYWSDSRVTAGSDSIQARWKLPWLEGEGTLHLDLAKMMLFYPHPINTLRHAFTKWYVFLDSCLTD